MTVTRTDVLSSIKDCERQGIFDAHVDPVDYNDVLPIDERFNYIKKGLERYKVLLHNLFVIKPYTWHHNRFVTHTIVKGRRHLKGIKSAIVTCNHVYMFDCLVAKHALKGHKVMVTAAEFNNRKGFLGDMMRSGGLLPFSQDFSNMKRFNQSVKHYLSRNNYVLFYPEQAMWYMYDKPRPFKNGAFHYAVKYDVPVIPMFITYRDSGKKDAEGLPIKYFTVNIMRPIFPDDSLNPKQNIELMKTINYRMCKDKYEEVYGTSLVFDTAPPDTGTVKEA